MHEKMDLTEGKEVTQHIIMLTQSLNMNHSNQTLLAKSSGGSPIGQCTKGCITGPRVLSRI